MKAMVLEEYNKPLRLRDIPMPEIGPDDILIRVRACGVCATDVKITQGKIPATQIPLVMGHEPAGEVAEAGSNVKAFQKGDHVLPLTVVPCNTCICCRTGRENLCTANKVGFNINGAFAEYMRIPASVCVKAPKSLSFPEASIVIGGITSPYHALKTRTGIQPGETVLIMGVGGLGLHGVQVARALGARVIAVDVAQERLDLAKQNGAHETVLYPCPDYVAKVKALCNGDGPDLVLETVSLPDTLTANVESLRRGGRLVMLGYRPGVDLIIPSPRIVLDEIDVIGARSITKPELEDLVDLVKTARIRPVVTKIYPLEDANQALADLQSGKIVGRAVLVP